MCSWYEKCVAQVIQNSSLSEGDQLFFNNNFPCNGTTEIQVSYDQHFYNPIDHQHMILQVNCNKKKCNQEKTNRTSI